MPDKRPLRLPRPLRGQLSPESAVSAKQNLHVKSADWPPFMHRSGLDHRWNPYVVDPETQTLRQVREPGKAAFETLDANEDYHDMPRLRPGNLLRPTPFARWLTYYRMRYGFTQKQLAAEAQIAAGTISEWETGLRAPRPDQIHRLSEIFYRRGGECY